MVAPSRNFDLKAHDFSGKLNLKLNIDRCAVYCNMKTGVANVTIRDREID